MTAYPGLPADPTTRICEWCGDKVAKAFEIPLRGRKKGMGSAMFVYVCPKHIGLGREATMPKERRAA